MISREDIIHMAREAGLSITTAYGEKPALERFATLIASWAAAEEREACAKVIDEMAEDMEREMEPSTAIAYVRSKAAAIRSRSSEHCTRRDVVTYGETTLKERNQGYKQAIKDCVVLLMIQHEAAKGSHNYWHVAANLIEAEYGVHSDA